MTSRRSARRRGLVTAGIALLAVAGAVAVPIALQQHAAPAPGCTVAAAGASFDLSTEQARNATTIAVSAATLGLPDHAVTIAVATADQETKLRNLPYGDLDSLGLFQQRPSQGWGSAAQVQDAHYAATAFLRRLSKVPDWMTLTVAEAAQAVQHSASGAAYARWEAQARALAQALSGELPAALRCQFTPTAPLNLAGLQRAAHTDLPGTLGAPSGSSQAGWRQAAWLVGHAEVAQIRTVAYAGQRWTARSGRWSKDASAGSVVSYG